MLGLRCVLDGIVTILLANEEHQKPTSRAQKFVPFGKRHVTEQEQSILPHQLRKETQGDSH